MSKNNVSRRQFLEASGLIAAGLGLVGCGGSGSGSDASGSASGTIKVGIMGPYSGDVAQYGLAVRNGGELFFKQYNANGGYNGKTIELDIQDEKGDATEAVNVYNKMVEEGVTCILGDVTSTPTIAIAQASVQDNMPLVTASATAADVISYGDNMFRACYTDPAQGTLMADFAAKQGYKKVGTIYNSGDDYSTGVNAAFVEECKAKGVEVVDQAGYAAGDVDFKSQLTTLMKGEPEAIMAPNYYQDNGKIVTQARELGYTGVFLGADGWAGIVGGDQDYASAEDLEGCYYDSSFSPSADSEVVKKFVEDYTAEYGEAPTNFCALGYDAAMVLAAGIEAAEDKGLEPASDDYKQAIIDGIAACEVEGVTGSISYDGTGDPVKSALVITFEGGEEKVFDTIEA